MSKSKLFSGLNLGDIAQGVKDRGEPSPMLASTARPVVPAAELALTGRMAPALERENIFQVDPKRCRPWKFHDRAASWYTRERCADLIESLPRLGQQEPAVARKLVGDPEFDYELISGMRRRYACELLGLRLKLRVVQVDDAKAAVLMHAENADRQDITAMERAVAFQKHLEANLFASQDALAEAMSVSKGQVAKMLKAASLLRVGPLEVLFRDVAAVPVDPAYKLATLLERPGARDVVFERARALAKKAGESPASAIRALLLALDASKRVEPLRREYSVGQGKLVVTRNARGKLALTLPKGLAGVDRTELVGVLTRVVKEL